MGFTNAVEWLGSGSTSGGRGRRAAGGRRDGAARVLIPVVARQRRRREERPRSRSARSSARRSCSAPWPCCVIAVSALALPRPALQGAAGATEPSTRRDLTAFLVALPDRRRCVGRSTFPSPSGSPRRRCWSPARRLHVVTVRHSGEAGDEDEPQPLYFDTPRTTRRRRPDRPPVLVSLAAIVGGAELFVGEVESIAASLGVAPLVLALVLAPLATELPEKLNSILWVRDGKDTLALGNVTGAMAFQATIPVAFGLVATHWDLEPEAIVASADRACGRRDRAARAPGPPRRPRPDDRLGGDCSPASSPSSRPPELSLALTSLIPAARRGRYLLDAHHA